MIKNWIQKKLRGIDSLQILVRHGQNNVNMYLEDYDRFYVEYSKFQLEKNHSLSTKEHIHECLVEAKEIGTFITGKQ